MKEILYEIECYTIENKKFDEIIKLCEKKYEMLKVNDPEKYEYFFNILNNLKETLSKKKFLYKSLRLLKRRYGVPYYFSITFLKKMCNKRHSDLHPTVKCL